MKKESKKYNKKAINFSFHRVETTSMNEECPNGEAKELIIGGEEGKHEREKERGKIIISDWCNC
jgi:hypothetical protein